ncbi:MAG: hypothetical protein K2J77_12325 [Oscillospiraceae bacterium]|nr:hypothetical protein [Oscillospiraceae bacterium]
MKTTKIVSILASAVMLVSLAGCQEADNKSLPTTINVSGNSTSEPSGETPSEPTSANAGGNETSDSMTSQSGEVSQPNPETNVANGGEVAGPVFVCNDGRGIPLFGGGTGAKYIDAINEVKAKVGSQVNVFSMIVPTSGSFYMPKGKEYENLNASEWDCIQRINAQFVGIIPVDAYTALSKHTNEEIFSRTDHHWHQLGAYYAAEEFVKTAAIDVPFAPLSEYERHDVEGYLGTLYASSDYNKTMRDNPETFTYYIPPNDFTTLYMNPEDKSFYQAPMFVKQDVENSYSTFMGGDLKVVHITTDVNNGRKLLIVKDSYPNSLVPCLTGSFQEMWTVDMRWLKDMKHFPHSISQIVRENGITDVLFCMNTFSAVGDNADNLELYLSEEWSVEISQIREEVSEIAINERGQ